MRPSAKHPGSAAQDSSGVGDKLGRLLGDTDGANEGLADGLPEGDNDGDADGTSDGLVLGERDGLIDGDWLGDIDGDSVGELEGLTLGDHDGLSLGLRDGLRDGDHDGDNEGDALGNSDGLADGLCVGLRDGETLGPEDGLCDGEPEGDSDGDVVGLELGDTLGLVLGLCEGLALGIALGLDDGLWLGDVDGKLLGDSVGASLGAVEGEPLGLEVGLPLGDAEGTALGLDVGLPLGPEVGEGDGDAVGDTDGLVVGSRQVSTAATASIRIASEVLSFSDRHDMPEISVLPYQGSMRSVSSGYVVPLESLVDTSRANSSASASLSVTRAVKTPPSPADVGAAMSRIMPSAVVARLCPVTTAMRFLFTAVLISSRARTLLPSATGSLSLSYSVARTSTSHPLRSISVFVRKRFLLINPISIKTVSLMLMLPFESASISSSWSPLWPGVHRAFEFLVMMLAWNSFKNDKSAALKAQSRLMSPYHFLAQSPCESRRCDCDPWEGRFCLRSCLR